MKLTGLIVVVLGLLGGLVSLYLMWNPTSSNHATATVGDASANTPNMTLLLILSAVAIGVGGVMFFFGGRGYYVSHDPRVRN